MRTQRTSFLVASIAAALLAASPSEAGFHTAGPWGTTTPDEGTKEVYGDAVDDHPGSGSDLAYCAEGVLGWAGLLNAFGWSYKVSTDASAWSSDFEEDEYDDIYADAADHAYISTHGSPDALYFNGSVGDDLLTSSEVFWGERDMETIAFDACQVLNATGRSNYSSRALNDGVHFLFGFETNALDTDVTAKNYAVYQTLGYTMRNAWIQATKDGHSSSYTGAYVRFYSANCDTYDDLPASAACDPKSGASAVTLTWSL